MNFLRSFCSFLGFCLVFHIASIQAAEHCGVHNGISEYCLDPDPHCCGTLHDGEGLCCENKIEAMNPNPVFCGNSSGQSWYCADLTLPYCCGFRSSDGAGLCCSSPDENEDSNSNLDSIFNEDSYSNDNSDSNLLLPDEWNSPVTTDNWLDDNNFNNEVDDEDDDDEDYSTDNDDVDDDDDDDDDVDDDDDDDVDDDVDDDDDDDVDDDVDDDGDDEYDDYEVYYPQWYVYVGAVCGIIWIVAIIVLIRQRRMRNRFAVQSIYATVTVPQKNANIGFENPISFPENKVEDV